MESIERFKALFHGLQRVYGRYDIDKDSTSQSDKVKGQAVTKKEPLLPGYWDLHINGERGLGVVPIRDDQCCVFCALDIDEYDLDLKGLNAECQKLQLPFVLCRTKSGGAHLYMFFKEPIRADIVRGRLKEMANALGYPAVEIFPKQKELGLNDVGNWINMPYFNEKGPTNRYALDADGNALPTIADFVKYAESMKVSKEAFVKLDVKPADKPFMDGPPCLQRLATHPKGFPSGTRNNALFNVGVYLRAKYPDHWREKIEEYNFTYMKPPLKSGEVQGTIKSLSKDKYFYKCDDAPIVSVCARDACLGRKFGVGGGQNDAGEVECLLGSLQKTVTVDVNGNELPDERVEWYLDVDGKQLTLTTQELVNQDRFIVKLMEAVQKMPMKIRPPRWHAIIKEKVESASIVELGPDTGRYGHIYEAVKDFCTAHGGAENAIEIETGMVWRDEHGYLWFKPQAFWEFLVRRGIYRANDSRQELYRIMKRNIGAEQKQKILDRSKNMNRTCWHIKDWDDVEKDQVLDPKSEGSEF